MVRRCLFIVRTAGPGRYDRRDAATDVIDGIGGGAGRES